MNKVVRFLQWAPLAPFLVVLFAFLHGITYAYEWVVFRDLMLILSEIVIGVLIYFFLFLFIIRDTAKASIFAAISVIVFFFLGYLIQGLYMISQKLAHLRYTLPVLVIMFGILFYLLIKSTNEKRIFRLNLFLNTLFLIYILWDLSVLTYKINSSEKRTFEIRKEVLNDKPASVAPDSLPDIYFLVFDAYASSVSLKENYSYDNSSVDSFLRAKQFYISTHSKSNYSETPFSISSTLNLNYFEDITGAKFPDDYPFASESMKSNRLMNILKNNGYTLYNLSVFDFENLYCKRETFASFSAIKMILGRSLIHYFEFVFNTYSSGKIRRQFDELFIETVKISQNKVSPKFVYLHVLLPHPPYYFNADGTVRSAFEYSQKKEVLNPQNYLNQLTYTNMLLKDLVSKLLNNGRKKIIILEGDHGVRKNIEQFKEGKDFDVQQNRFKNLNAYYFYDHDYNMLYDSISPVNSFRVVLNRYLKKDIPLLHDSAVY